MMRLVTPLLDKPRAMLREFLRLEAASGLILIGAALLALAVANTSLASAYQAALHVELGFRIPGFALEESLAHWINDGLMALFFLLVGLEIKRETLEGELASWRRLALPGFAALGGVIMPALIYIGLNRGLASGALHGWAIPAATDIAFALGIASLLGPRLPASLKVFLTALAIIDDLAAILIIALFYSRDLQLLALGLAGLGIAVLALLNYLGVTRIAAYLLIGVIIWLCVLKSGVHATLAGVAVAFTVPLRARRPAPIQAAALADRGVPAAMPSPLRVLEHRLHGWVAFLIIQIFGFANAGLSLAGVGWATLLHPVTLGIAAGLFLGKQIGVLGAALLALKLGLAAPPARATRGQLYGVSILCGIGFTMSLFIGDLAFADDALALQTKLGVFLGTLLSTAAGALVAYAAGHPAKAARAPA